MTPPPTNIDGTDITGATIDGQDVQEITVDGQTVFTAGIIRPNSGVARWTFDNADTSGSTAIDIWGGNNGTINGATTGASGANITYATNESYSFDGNDDSVSSIAIDLSTFSAGSIALWVFINKDQQTWFSTRLPTDSPMQFMTVGSGQLRFRVGANDFRGSNINKGQWYHLVGTFDSNERKMYVDGSLDSTGSASSPTGTSCEIGTDYYGNFHDGRIDDVRVYSKALSGTEVSSLYSTGSING